MKQSIVIKIVEHTIKNMTKSANDKKNLNFQ